MKPFTYERATTPAEAAAAVARTPGAKFIAGGTNLLDLMKLQIETPAHLVDVNGLALDRIEPTADGGLRIGALVRNTDLAADARVRARLRACCRARCSPAPRASCATRRPPPATCCSARAARTSTTPTSPATSASPAAAARRSAASAASTRSSAPATPASPRIRATWRWRCACSMPTVETVRPDGATRVHPDRRLPPPAGRHAAHRDRRWSRGELITAVTLPQPVGGTHIYRKVRDRASYAFALVSVAADRAARRHGPRRARRRRAQAVARRGRRGGAAARRQGGRATAARRRAGRRTTTRSSCRWSSARSPRCWRKRGAEP